MPSTGAIRQGFRPVHRGCPTVRFSVEQRLGGIQLTEIDQRPRQRPGGQRNVEARANFAGKLQRTLQRRPRTRQIVDPVVTKPDIRPAGSGPFMVLNESATASA